MVVEEDGGVAVAADGGQGPHATIVTVKPATSDFWNEVVGIYIYINIYWIDLLMHAFIRRLNRRFGIPETKRSREVSDMICLLLIQNK